MDKKLKVLVCGDVRGNFKYLFDAIDKLNRKKGPFDFMFCVGEFFGSSSASTWEPYKNEIFKVPILTYILGASREDAAKHFTDPNGSELCPNVYHLGKRGILTSGGLKIAYVSGSESAAGDGVRITRSDVETVRDVAHKGKTSSEYVGIDVLLTSDWPKNVCNGVEAAEDAKSASDAGSELIAWLASELRPRYHFAGLNHIFYERAPYRNDPSASTHYTRFIAVASVSPGKKWKYGMELTPIHAMKKDELYMRSTVETETPYRSVKLNPEPVQFFFDVRERKGGRKRKLDISQDKCWFCLAGKQDMHTVVGIGDEAYVALCKGGLRPRHLLLSPVKHLESYLHLPRGVRAELDSVKDRVRSLYRKTNDVAVFFERYYRTSHMQLNAVPVPERRARNVKSAFASCAKKHGMYLNGLAPGAGLEEVVELGKPYLYVELPDGERMYAAWRDNFPMHFAREALAGRSVLDVEDNVDWRKCTLSEAEEKALAGELRAQFPA